MCTAKRFGKKEDEESDSIQEMKTASDQLE
jgi:hypothetical protein